MLTDVDVVKDDFSSVRRVTPHSIDAILKSEKPRVEETQDGDRTNSRVKPPHTDRTGM